MARDLTTSMEAQTTAASIYPNGNGSYPLGLLPLALLSGIGCLLVLTLGRRREAGMVTSPAE